MSYKKVGRRESRSDVEAGDPPDPTRSCPPLALVRAGLEGLSAIIRGRGELAGRRFIEVLTASIRKRNRRTAYARAVKRSFDWSDEPRLELHEIEAITVAAYVEKNSAPERLNRR
jgi:hypothetical protein